MKRKTVWIVLAIMLCLSGCGSDQPPATVATQPSATAPSVFEPEAWAEIPFLSLLPEPDESWTLTSLESYMAEVALDNMNREKHYALVEQISAAGFDQDLYTWEFFDAADGSVSLHCVARDVNGNYMGVRTAYIPSEGVKGEYIWTCSLDVRNRLLEFNVSTTPPSYVQKTTEQWDAHELRAQVPAPPTEYWSGHMLDGHYVARLEYTSYESIKAYAQELRDAGFIYRQTIHCDPGWDQYYYIGANEAGYSVWLMKIGVEVSHVEAPLLLIYPPEADDSPADWDFLHGFGTYLPAPPCMDWVYTKDPTGNRFQFADLDYKAAWLYLKQLRGLNLAPTTFLEEDREAEKFLFSAGVLSEEIKGKIVFSFRFSYDPTNADCPCTLEET